MEKKKRVTITLTPKAHEKKYAKEKHTTVSAAIEDWIWNYLNEKPNDKKK